MLDKEVLANEVIYKAVRSSGAGGQNVNKVASKVEVYFDISNASCIDEDEKARILTKLSNRCNSEGILMLSCQESRSQAKNKELVFEKLIDLIEKALHVPRKRKATKMPGTIKIKRLEAKKKKGEIKKNRGKFRL